MTASSLLGTLVLIPLTAETLRLESTADIWLSDATDSERDSSAGKHPRFKIKSIQEMAAIRFDASPAAGHEILKADLHMRRAGKDMLRYVRVSTINQDWAEGTTASGYGPASGATYMWADANIKKSWAWPGSQFCDVIMSSGNSLATWAEREELPDGWVSVSLTPQLVYSMVAGDTDGLAVMDGGNLSYFNNFIHSSESPGSEPYIQVTLGKEVAAPPAPIVKAEPSAERAHLKAGAVKLIIDEDPNVFCWKIKIDGQAIERWRVKHPAAEGETVMFFEDLPPSKELNVEVIAVSIGGKASDAAHVKVVSSDALSQGLRLVDFTEPGKGASPPERAEKVKVWALPGLVKVSPESSSSMFDDLGATSEYKQSNAVWDGKRIRLHGAQGEYVSYQLCIEKLGEAALNGIRVAPALLKGPNNSTIGGSEIELYKNWYTRNGNKQWQPAFCVPLKPGEPFQIPDPKRELASQQNQTIYVDVYIPKDATPGVYSGEVRVESEGEATIDLPVSIMVHGFALPDRLGFWPELNAYNVPRNAHDYYRLAHQHRCVANYWRFQPQLEGQGKGIKTIWERYDQDVGPLLSGEAFRNNRRAGVPVPCMYLPFEDSWPTALSKENYNYEGYWPKRGDDNKHLTEHYMKAPYIGDALSQDYKDAFLSVQRQFIEHFKENGWTQTEMQCFYGGKNTHRTQYGSNMWWTTDEPYHWDDWLSLQFFCRLWAKGRGDADPTLWMARADISRPNWQGKVLDGIVDTVYFGGYTSALRYRRTRLLQQESGLKIMAYGSANSDSESNTRSVVMMLNVWTNGAHGILPWQTLGDDSALDNGDPRGGGNALIVPGKRFGISVVGDMRLKAFREGQQLTEYMTILADRYELQREQVKAMVHRAVNIQAGQKAGSGADNADAMQFNTLKAWQISELRRALAELILNKEGVAGVGTDLQPDRTEKVITPEATEIPREGQVENPSPQSETQRGKALAAHTKVGPKLDGTLDDPVWQNATLLAMGDVIGPGKATLTSTVRILFGNTILYIGVECQEPDTGSLKSVAQPDGELWSDDCVEVFISADPDIGYKHIGLNPKGTIFDQSCPAGGENNIAWNVPLDCKTHIEKNQRWTATLAIPLKELDAYVGDGLDWRINVTRCRPARGRDPYTEYSWAILPSTSFHQPAAFGRLTGVTIPEQKTGVTRQRKEPVKSDSVVDVGEKVGDVTVFYKFDFDNDNGGFRWTDNMGPAVGEGVTMAKTLRLARKKAGGGFGVSLPVNIPGATDLKIAYHGRASGMPYAGLNASDRLSKDNTTSNAYRWLSDKEWRPILYYLEAFRYNSQRVGTRVRPETFYTEINFHGEQAGSTDTWMEMDNFVLYRGNDRTPPSRVEGVGGEAAPGEVFLWWRPSTDNTSVMLYVISRSRDGGPFEKIAESVEVVYKDRPVATGIYQYRVLACDFEENLGEWSLPASIKVTRGEENLKPDVAIEFVERNAYRERVLEIAGNGKGDRDRNLVMCYGDSLTGATGYPLEVQGALGTKKVVGFGFPSQQTSFGLANAASNFDKAGKPCIALILFGTNNSKSPQAIEQAMKDLETIASTAAERGIIPILGTIPPRGFNDPESKPEAAYNQALVETCRRLRIPCGHLFEEYQRHPDLRKLIADDGVHNTREGMQTSARVWKRVVDQVNFVLRDRE